MSFADHSLTLDAETQERVDRHRAKIAALSPEDREKVVELLRGQLEIASERIGKLEGLLAFGTLEEQRAAWVALGGVIK